MALERKTARQSELQSLDQQGSEREAADELTENEKKLRHKIETFRTKKEVIKAQYSAAEAQVRISEAANGVGEQMADLGLAIQRAEQKTEDMKARASAVEELEAARDVRGPPPLGGGQDDIDRQLSQLSAGAQVHDELAKMKAELGSGSGSSAGRAGRKGERVIVRISGEGQFQLPDGDAERLNQYSTTRPSPPSRRATRPVSRVPRRCSTWSRRTATLGEDELSESDVILPPRDITFAEAKGEFTGDGLIPD